MDKIKRLAARLRGGANGRRRMTLLSEEMDAEYAGLVAEAVRKIDNHFDIAGFVISVLDESGMPSEAQAVSLLLSDSERVQKAKKLAEGTLRLKRPTECKRCGSELRKGYCIDATCPFSDRLQPDPEGWRGHPDHPAASRRGRREARTGQVETGPPPGAVRRDSMTWHCHDCGTSKRHPLVEGAPECSSCGKPMVSDRHLKDR